MPEAEGEESQTSVERRHPAVQIRYQSDRRIVDVEHPGETILDVSIRYKVPHFRECGGSGRCTTCRVRVLDGVAHVTPRTPAEARIAEARGWDEFTRLACQTRVTGPVTIERLVLSGGEASRLQLEELPTGEGKELRIGILFCDIREFTPFVERNLAFDVVHMLNRFFTHIGEPILLNNGVIYQYVGDQIIGLFGVGGDPPERSSLAAIRAGLAMLAALDELNARLAGEFDTTLDIGVGVHFGSAIVGHMGHPSHRQFGVVGDAVNVASRIQAMNRELGTRLLASEELLAEIRDPPIVTGRGAEARLKGKVGTLRLREVLGLGREDPTLVAQETIGWILDKQELFAATLYERMFALDPSLRALFRGAMERQGQMVVHMVQVLTYALCRPETLALGLRDLGRRHVDYGVRAESYDVFRVAFLEAIRVALGERWTERIGGAWAALADAIVEQMIAASR